MYSIPRPPRAVILSGQWIKSLIQSDKDKDSNLENNSIPQLIQPAINRHLAATYIFQALTLKSVYLSTSPRSLFPSPSSRLKISFFERR